MAVVVGEVVSAALVTVMVYVSVVVPSWAVTTTGMTLEPTLRLIEPDGEPEVTGVPLTVTVAFAWFTVGVTVRLATPFRTLSVYEVVPEAKVGESVP